MAAATAGPLLGLGPLLILWLAGVPLGETGRFIYRWSPLLTPRLISILPLIFVIGLFALALWRLRTGKGHWALTGAFILFAAWNWWAPPQQILQHGFNLRSPSHDGAFVDEAETVDSICNYLVGFNERLRRSPEEMRGTRVLSNTPGMTVLAWWTRELLAPPPGEHDWIERYLLETRQFPPGLVEINAPAIRFSFVLAAVWLASAFFAWKLGRLFLSPVGAAFFTLVLTFNPQTLHFSPGKDSAQLLTINAVLWGFLAAWRGRSAWHAAFGGAALIMGMCVGLVHAWVALAVVLACTWESRRSAGLKSLAHCLAWAAGGAAAALFLIWLITSWNAASTFLATARRFREIQDYIPYDRRLWAMIGLPLFLAFLAPGWWSMLPIMRCRGWGFRLTVCTAAVMLLTYVMGVTYELPRLWIAFLPPLVLGVAASVPLLRRRPGGRVTAFLIVLASLHILFSAAHWAMLDARESEFRLISGRFFM